MEAPEKVGRYEVRSVLGRGGMGKVFKAWDPIFDRYVALKTINPQFYNDVEFRKRFMIEAKAAAQLKHPNIVEIYDWIEQNDRAYQVLELLEGASLQERMVLDEKARRGEADGASMRLKEKLKVVIDALTGLKRAHDVAIIHRDIKPANVFLTNNGIAKVLDFGLARIGAATSLTTGPMGTPAYMSPEQFAYEDLDHRTDIWSCGVMLYELIAGQVPFPGKEFSTVARKVLTSAPPPLEVKNLPAIEELSRIISRALTKDRNRRYQDALQMANDLARFARNVEVEPEAAMVDVVPSAAPLVQLLKQNEGLLSGSLLENFLRSDEPLDRMLWTIVKSGAPDPETLRRNYWAHLSPIHDRLVALLPHLQRAHSLFKDARAHEQDGRLEAAIAKVRQIIQEFPNLKSASTFLESLNYQVRKRDDVEGLLREARKIAERGELERAQQLLLHALGIDPLHQQVADLYQQIKAEADKLRARVDSAEETVQLAPFQIKDLSLEGSAVIRHPDSGTHETAAQRIEALFQSARSLAQGGDEDRALHYLSELLALAPEHEGALGLKRTLESRKLSRQKQGERASKMAKALEAERNLLLDEALVLSRELVKDYGSDQAAVDLLGRLQGKRKQLEGLLLQARNLLRARGPEVALGKVESALALYPSSSEAYELKAQIEAQLAREREGSVWERLRLRLGAGGLAMTSVALVAAIAVVIWLLIPPPPPPPPATELGFLWVDIAPWAEVTAVRKIDTGETSVPVERNTPVLLSLLPGRYELDFANHFSSGEVYRLEAEVSSNQTSRLTGALPGFLEAFNQVWP
jgi:serine/threonine-protein kinase